MSRFWSESIHQLTPYTPGEQPVIEGLLKLNTNENPYGPSEKVIAAIKASASDTLRRYPDPESSQLKRALANYYSLETEQVFVGNSSDEVLAHVFRGLLKQGTPILFPDITYSFYPVYCQLFDIKYRCVDVAEDYRINLEDYLTENGGIIFANPNAPTGLAANLSEIEWLLERNSDSVVVIDEAYVDFSDVSAISLIDRFENLLVVQTSSKSRSLAGLRVGWACGHADLIEALERIKNSFHPYTLDRLAQAGALAAIEDTSHFEATREKIIATRERFADELGRLNFKVLPSAANFVLVQHQSTSAKILFSALRERGIVVRYFDKPRLDNFLRITIGTDQEMDRLLDSLNQILSEQ